MPRLDHNRNPGFVRAIQAYQFARPFIRRYLPAAFQVGERFVTNPLAAAAWTVGSNIIGGYQGTKDYLPDLFSPKDSTYAPSAEQSAKIQRIYNVGSVKSGFTTNTPNLDQSGPSELRHKASGGTRVDVNMVRRLGYRRRFRRNPGTAFRRIFRSWSGQSELRRRFRGRNWNKPELKYFDVFASGSPPQVVFLNVFTQAEQVTPQGGNAILLNDVAQNVSATGRIGNQIVIKSILVRGCLSLPTEDDGDITYSQCVRIMIIKDRQANGAVPVITDVLAAPVSGNPVTQPMNLDYRSRFKVLCDRHYVLSGGTNAAEYFFQYYSKRKHVITYTGNTGTAAAIKTNAIWLLLLGPGANGGTVTNRPHFSAWNARIRFVDP